MLSIVNGLMGKTHGSAQNRHYFKAKCNNISRLAKMIGPNLLIFLIDYFPAISA
jgi:hypothetical protein